MKSFSARIFATLATLGLGLAPAACGEKPSFKEQEVTDHRTNADSTVRKTPAIPIGGKGGVDDPAATKGGAPGASDDGATDAGPADAGTPGGDGDGGDASSTHQDGAPGAHGDNPSSGGDSSSTTNGRDPKDPNATGTNEGGLNFPTTVPANGTGEGTPNLPPRKTMAREQSFPADAQTNAEVTKALDDPYSTQTIALRRNATDRAKSLHQITRPLATDTFTQGTAGDAISESFDQVAGRLLDILVVIDDSYSMAEEQANLATKLAPLLSSVSTADWQIAVTTTDPNEPCLRALIKKSDTDIATKFKNAINAGVDHAHDKEMPILTAVKSLKGDCLTQPWIRKDSNISVLIVSDEDNCSYKGYDCVDNKGNYQPWAYADYLVNYLASIRDVGKTARVHGILWHPSQTHAQCPTGWVDDLGEHRAWYTSKAVDATGGTWGSICDADYSATLNNISKNILVTLNSKFMLQQAPDMSSLRVFVGAAEVTTGFTVTGRLLEFATPPADGAKITVTYRHGSTPTAKSFPLRFKPVADKLSVTVNGQLAQPSDYQVTINAADQSVDFFAYPADKAAIAVAYTRDVALNTQFALGEPARAGSLTVRVNGVATTDFTLQEATGVVTFPAAPAESATLDFAYTAVGSPVLIYPFAVDGAAPVDLAVFDADTGAPVKFTYAVRSVVIDPSEFVEGRRITFRYDNLARQDFSVELPNAPVLASVVVHGGQKDCVAPAVKVTGTTVAVDGCGFADDVTTVSVRYNFVAARYQAFTFTGDKLPASNAYQVWNVFVNGMPATGFTRTANVVSFDAPLAPGAVVKIQLIQDDN